MILKVSPKVTCDGTHATGECFHYFFKFSQTFKGPDCNLIEVFSNIASGVVNGKSQTLQKARLVLFFMK